MYKSSAPQDAIVLLDDCTPVTATASGGVTWPKTGLTYVSLAGVGEITVSPSGTYSVSQAYEFSNDLINWKAAPMQNDSSVPLAENTTVTGVGSATMSIPTKGWLYFRVAITYTSGTYNCRVVGRAGSAAPATQPVTAIQDGTWTVQMGNTPNTTPILVSTVPTFTSAKVTASGQIRSAAGKLATITISPLTATPTGGLLTIYDSPAATGTVLHSEWVSATTPTHTVSFNCTLASGLYVLFDGTLANVEVQASHSA